MILLVLKRARTTAIRWHGWAISSPAESCSDSQTQSLLMGGCSTTRTPWHSGSTEGGHIFYSCIYGVWYITPIPTWRMFHCLFYTLSDRPLELHFSAQSPHASHLPTTTWRKSQVSEALSTANHVFIQHGAVRKPLQHPYDGPYPVVKRTDKHFTVDIDGRKDIASVHWSLEASSPRCCGWHTPHLTGQSWIYYLLWTVSLFA